MNSITADYESVITTLGVTRLDMDVESSSLNDTAGINRRNQAIALIVQWAAATASRYRSRTPSRSSSMAWTRMARPCCRARSPTGRVTTVNIMVFDYYIAKEGVVNMGQAAVNAATNTHAQLSHLPEPDLGADLEHGSDDPAAGIDDLRKKTEVTTLADATTMLNFAQANNLNLLSMWAIQRDNGGCPGTVDSNTCSGITQNTWDFSHLLEPFTG